MLHVVFIIGGHISVVCCVHYTWGYICCMLCSLYLGIYMLHVVFIILGDIYVACCVHYT